jgi:hypothetical protein
MRIFNRGMAITLAALTLAGSAMASGAGGDRAPQFCWRQRRR